jgi:hypothetical protein
VQDGAIALERTIIYDTQGGQFQDAIQINRSSATFENLTIYGSGRMGIFSFASNATVRNTILAANASFGFFSDDGQGDLITYSDVWANGLSFGNVTPGEGVIFEDPLFIDAFEGNFNLSMGSPCIDAGDPNSPPDRDGTRADIGALAYNPAVPVELASFSAAVFEDDVTLLWRTASETNNYGFEIQRRDGASSFTKIVFIEGSGTTASNNDYIHVDEDLAPGHYFYRLKQIDFDGTFVLTDEIQATVETPREFALHANYPNPFNPSTTIGFELPVATEVKLDVYNINGSFIRTILEEKRGAGRHTVVWGGDDASGKKLASGIYILRFETARFVKTLRTTLLK